MSGPTIYDISTFQKQDDDVFLLDCNVLMYIYYTFGGYSNSIMNPYKTFFNNIATCPDCIIYPAVLISEFSNTYIQREYKRYLRTNSLSRKDFDFKKNYKKTNDYVTTINDISDIINNQIMTLPSSIIKTDDFEQMNLKTLFKNQQTFDFNDRYYGELCKRNHIYIVTNDSDFEYIDNIKILTANPNMLSLQS